MMKHSQIHYKETCLSFMDIQGFENMVLNLYPDKPMVIFEILDEFNRVQYICPTNWSSWLPEIVSFSDSIVRGNSRRKLDYSLDTVIINEVQAIRLIQQKLLTWRPSSVQESSYGSFGVFLRGGLSVGPAFINQDDNLVFGPSVIEAVKLEDVESSPFRIVLSPKTVTGHPKAVADLRDERIIAQDSDGLWYVDYLSVNSFAKYGFWIELERLREVRDILQAHISRYAEDKKLFGKYLWAARKHNESISSTKALHDALLTEGLGMELSRLMVQLGGECS